jgi:hypothetical protein
MAIVFPIIEYRDFDVETLGGVVAPPGMSKKIAKQLAKEVEELFGNERDSSTVINYLIDNWDCQFINICPITIGGKL